MITKGISFISSTFSRLTDHPSLYSHIVFVHVDDKSGAVETIESYIGVGVDTYDINTALKNENARILLLRPKDQKLAKAAADYMYKRVMDSKKKKHLIPYDFKADFSDNSKLSCEEVAYDAYKTASDGEFVIPQYSSEVAMQNTSFLSSISLKDGPLMVPADMELDSRFDIVADWTDTRIMRDSTRKDTVLSAIFNWMQKYNYKIHPNLSTVGVDIIWGTRPIPGLWNMMSHLAKPIKNFSSDVPLSDLKQMASLKEIGGILLSQLTEADEAQYKETGYWMSESEMQANLESYRFADYEEYKHRLFGTKLHNDFHP